MLIDVGLVFFNRPEFVPIVLDRLFRSIAASEEHQVRLFVADNASCEETQEILWKHRKAFERFLVYRENVGLVTALNELGAMMTADYIAFMDCDVLVPPEIWDRLFLPLIHCPQVGGVSPMWKDPVEACVKQAFAKDAERFEHGIRIVNAPNNAIIHAMRRSLFVELGGYRDFGALAGYGAESDFTARTLDKGYRVVFDRTVTAVHLPNTIGDNPEHRAFKRTQAGKE